MKFNKNFFQMVTLLVSMFSVLLAIFTTVYNADLFYKSNVNEIVLALATVIISLLFGTYILQILRAILKINNNQRGETRQDNHVGRHSERQIE